MRWSAVMSIWDNVSLTNRQNCSCLVCFKPSLLLQEWCDEQEKRNETMSKCFDTKSQRERKRSFQVCSGYGGLSFDPHFIGLWWSAWGIQIFCCSAVEGINNADYSESNTLLNNSIVWNVRETSRFTYVRSTGPTFIIINIIYIYLRYIIAQ